MQYMLFVEAEQISVTLFWHGGATVCRPDETYTVQVDHNVLAPTQVTTPPIVIGPVGTARLKDPSTTYTWTVWANNLIRSRKSITAKIEIR